MNFLKKHYAFIRRKAPLILILIFASTLLSVNLTKPFIGHHDWNGAFYSNIARNYLRYGLTETKFGQVLNYDVVQKSNFRFDTHYPPLFPILLSISFAVFGVNEWAARLTSLLAALGAISMTYLIGKKIFGNQIAYLSALLTAVLPITIYFSKIPVHDVIVLPFVLLSIYFYYEFFKKNTKGNLLKLSAILIIAHLTHWSGYFVTPLFALHYLIFSDNLRKIQTAILFPSLSILMFSVHLLYVFLLTGSPFGGGLLDIFLDRLNISDKPAGYSLLNFINLQLHLIVSYYTRPLLFFSLVTCLWAAFEFKNLRKNTKLQFLIILAIFGVTYNIVFRNAAFIHDYTIIYLLPFLSVTAAFGLYLFSNYFKLSNLRLIILSFVLIFLVAIERTSFTKALIQSESFKPGEQIGKIINKNTKSGEETLILSEDFKRYFEVQTAYYADRAVNYMIPSSEQIADESFIKQFAVIIAIPARDTPRRIVEILNASNQSTIIDEFHIYNISSDQTKIITR